MTWEGNAVQTGLPASGHHRSPAAGTDRRSVPGAGLRSRVCVEGKSFARGGQKWRARGVTYGPFAPGSDGSPFPEPGRVRDDFMRMRAIGINAIRTYHVPPEWLLSLADEQGLAVLVDVPWPKHLCFLDSAVQRDARQAVQEAGLRGRRHPCLLAYSICNEISPSIVRWHGANRVERFLAELGDVARQADPEALVTYANFPPTEYLDLPFLDFTTFNVYLHDLETFRRYLVRLQNLVGDRPLLLGEIGMDSFRHGELEQANFLGGHVREAARMGLAGAFVFSWTDEWHTGGYAIEDWAFGITHADRSPKAAYHALAEVFPASPAELLPRTPRISVIVCTYNGGATLEQCLQSLQALDYPDYEVIVVDDGSTDDTAVTLARFPGVRVIRQANRGLSTARNAGLEAATGEIVAYTDSDCFADGDWLSHLVYQLMQSGAAAVGGPNLTPEDGWLAGCVAASPGQPTHVLESDSVAEHIPGCNMAFRRDALLAINGFDPQYKKAGDDVDVCWRLQQAGMWITFAPAAFVWHHRRQTPAAYLRQQAGYGEAEALLRFKHPDRFTSLGEGKWRGVLYGPSPRGLSLSEPLIYRGTFGTGLFQCLYQPGPAHWTMLPSTLEWHAGVGVMAIAGFFWPVLWLLAGFMLGLSVLVAGLKARQAHLPRKHESGKARLLIAGLCYTQPLIRSWKRYHTRLFSYRPPEADHESSNGSGRRLPWNGIQTTAYWTEEGYDRTELLRLFLAYLIERRWTLTLDSGWNDWDVEVYCHPWTVLQVITAEEEHGGNRRLIRVRYRLRPTTYTRALAGASLIAAVLASVSLRWGVTLPLLAGLTAVILLAACLVIWWRSACRASQPMAIFDNMAHSMGLVPCDDQPGHGEQTDGANRSTATRATS